MKSFNKTLLSAENKGEPILSECRELLEKYKFSEDEITVYLEDVKSVLAYYLKKCGAGTEVSYIVRKRAKRIELKLIVNGEKRSPLDEVDDISERNSVKKALMPMLVNKTEHISHLYIRDRNVVYVTSAQIHGKSFWRSPMLWAVILGLGLGLLCLWLPHDVSALIINDFANPIQSAIINVITKTMGPFILLSVITSISTLANISELTNLGLKTILRFFAIILSVMAAGIGVSLLLYHNFGQGIVDFQPRQIVDIFLGIIPTDPLSPLINGDMAQIVILGLLIGTGVLLLGDKISALKTILIQLSDLTGTILNIVMIIIPAVPFFSVFITIAKGDGASLLKGWEYILATYAVTILCGVFKLVKVSVKFHVKISVLLKKLKPMLLNAFASANDDTYINLEYDISEKQLGIKPQFSNFWIPMSQALLNPKLTINLIIPPFLILKALGEPISLSFMIVLILLVLELSIANTGTTAGWSLLFAALAFPAEFAGTYMMYKLFTTNFVTAYGAMERGLEQIEAANKFDALDVDLLRA